MNSILDRLKSYKPVIGTSRAELSDEQHIANLGNILFSQSTSAIYMGSLAVIEALKGTDGFYLYGGSSATLAATAIYKIARHKRSFSDNETTEIIDREAPVLEETEAVSLYMNS